MLDAMREIGTDRARGIVDVDENEPDTTLAEISLACVASGSMYCRSSRRSPASRRPCFRASNASMRAAWRWAGRSGGTVRLL